MCCICCLSTPHQTRTHSDSSVIFSIARKFYPKLQTMDSNGHEFELREQDRWLPIANVARLMKNTLPQTAKVSKDAKECMQECVSEFILFITLEALDKCLRDKRKTINGEDILYSMHDLGFENYAEVLKIYLAKYREQQALRQERGETRTLKRGKQLVAAVPAPLTLQLPQLEPAPFVFEQEEFSNQIHQVQLAEQPLATELMALPEPFFSDYNQQQKEYPIDEFLATNERPIGEEDIDSLTVGIANGNSTQNFF